MAAGLVDAGLPRRRPRAGAVRQRDAGRGDPPHRRAGHERQPRVVPGGPRPVGRAAPQRRPPARVPRRPRRRPSRRASCAARPTSPPARRWRWRCRARCCRAPTKPLGVAKLRGVESRGMILSARELGLGDDHSGIMELPEGPPPGTPLAEVLPLGRDRPGARDHLQPAGLPRGVRRGARGARRHRRAAGAARRVRPAGGGRTATSATTRRWRSTTPTCARGTWPACSSTCASAPRPAGWRGAWRPPACGPSTTSWTSPTT